MVKQEQRVIVAEASKKRWVAPEVTRLEFPKTAGSGHNPGIDSSLSYALLS